MSLKAKLISAFTVAAVAGVAVIAHKTVYPAVPYCFTRGTMEAYQTHSFKGCLKAMHRESIEGRNEKLREAVETTAKWTGVSLKAK